MKELFIILIIIVFYTYIGYGILLYLLVKIKERIHPSPTYTHTTLPSVTIVIAAYNEEQMVAAKMANTNLLTYPKERLSLLWVIDGSTDSTNRLLAQYPNVKICFTPERKGKTAALNHAMLHVSTDIVVFTDANTMLNPEALDEMISHFANPQVGCVAGEKRIFTQTKESASSSGEGLYWKYESFLKQLDYRLYSTVGAAGELFAIRSNLFEAMPEDTLLDDFILSLTIAQKGYRIAYCKEAYATESGSADLRNEQKRKERISAGGLQSIWRLRPLLNPFKYGTLSFQYISHRVLRWTITPYCFFLLYPVNVALALTSPTPFVWVFLFLQTLFYLLAGLGYLLQKKEIKFTALFAPLYLVFMNSNVIKALPYLLRQKGKGAWEKAERK